MLTKAQRISEAELDELDAKYDGQIAHLWQDASPRRSMTAEQLAGAVEWEIVFRSPTRLEALAFKQATDATATKAQRSLAEENLCRSTVIRVVGADPSKPVAVAFDEVYERFAFMPSRCANYIARLAGLEIELQGK